MDQPRIESRLTKIIILPNKVPTIIPSRLEIELMRVKVQFLGKYQLCRNSKKLTMFQFGA